MVIIDTSVIIDHLRSVNDKKNTVLVNFVKNHPKEILAISLLSIQELYEGQSTKFKLKEQQLLAIISPLKILDYTFEIAQKAGKLARDLPQNISLADAAIATTCMVYDCGLLTLDKKDFGQIKGLNLVEIGN